MNAPFRAPDKLSTTGTLKLFALFHLNLAFSSIEEEQRGEVIARCYWPMLSLAAKHGPIGIEITGYTLEEIARLDPEWIGRAKALLASGRVELIGSGYSQMIGPLVPARVTEQNLKIGNEIYRRLLGAVPSLALVNEQAYSAGLVGLYLDAGYRAILMDWDNCAAHHPEWPLETRYHSQAALGSDGRSVGLIWTNTVAFQKLQRFAHGDIELAAYLDYVRGHADAEERALCLYASDAEIFDFRPGRYRTEEAMRGGEWHRLAQAFEAIVAEPNIQVIRPSEILAMGEPGEPLHLESAACPIPVKKQRKYNLARWAVTGRDDIGINAACERIYRGITASTDEAAWKDLCYLWSSDFRTHITEKRWKAYCERLSVAEAQYDMSDISSPLPSREGARSVATRGRGLDEPLPHDPSLRSGSCPLPQGEGEIVSMRHVTVETPTLNAVLDRRRGLAIECLQFASHAKPALGGLPHGYFDDISVQADWYTGDCVFEAPGEPKVTDLEWCEARRHSLENGDICVAARIETPNGPIEKSLTFGAHESRVDFDVMFHWQNWGRGSLRLGHFTLLPDAFDPVSLSLTTHNGGKQSETFALAGQTVDHGAPVSFLVSSSHGLGMTEGWAELGDANTRVRIDVDRTIAPLLALLTHRRVGGRLFCQLALSALELDDTRKPSSYREGPRRFRFSVSAA